MNFTEQEKQVLLGAIKFVIDNFQGVEGCFSAYVNHKEVVDGLPTHWEILEKLQIKLNNNQTQGN